MIDYNENRFFSKMDGDPSFNSSLILVLLVAGIGYFLGFFRHAIEKISPGLSPRFVFAALALFFGVQFVLLPVLFYLFLTFFSLPITEKALGWGSVCAIFLSSTLIFIYFSKIPPRFQEEVLWRPWTPSRNRFYHFIFGLLSWFIVYPFILLTVNFLNMIFYIPEILQAPVQDLLKVRDDPLLFTSLATGMAFLVPVVEELLFRGMLQTWLRKYFNWKLAVVFTSALFAVLHLNPGYGWRNLEFFFALFVLSLFMGYIYEKRGSIWAPIGLHTAFNGVSALFLTLGFS